jgi:hypothetical protein
MKLLKALLASGLFLTIYALIYLCHIHFFTVDVVFYAALLDAVIAVIISALIFIFGRRFRNFSRFEKSQLVLIWVLMGYAIAISGPTVIDRSLSFYLLEKLQQRGGGIQQSRFNDIFTGEYIREHRLIDVRLTEQLQSGTIIIKNDCVLLTPKGDMLARFGRFFRGNLLPKKRLLMGSYTDQLTDPFRRSDAQVDYTCTAP